MQEGLKAVREKAGFLEAELRGQLADARAFLADERQIRRTAEAALATSEAALRRSLDSAQAETAALRHQVRMPALPASSLQADGVWKLSLRTEVLCWGQLAP